MLIPAAGSELYPPPTNLSVGGVASWSQPIIASGSALPNIASAADGDLFILTDAASWTVYRFATPTWIQQVASGSGGGGGTTDHSALSNLDYGDSGHTGFVSTSTFEAHTASSTDPHGSDETITGTLTVGSGTADTQITRNGTGTIGLASYVVIIPNAATPSAIIATGTLWYDSNDNKLKCYDGAAWNGLW